MTDGTGISNQRIVEQPIATWITSNPALRGVYLYSIADQLGAITPYNYLSLFNPLGSGRLVVVAGFFISSYSVGNATATAPIRGWRTTAASGGTLATAADIVKFNNTSPNAIAEARSVNPTVTTTAPFFNSPPPVGTGAGTAFVHAVEAPPGGGAFLCSPGEGVVVRNELGDVDQHFNFTIAWGEI